MKLTQAELIQLREQLKLKILTLQFGRSTGRKLAQLMDIEAEIRALAIGSRIDRSSNLRSRISKLPRLTAAIRQVIDDAYAQRLSYISVQLSDLGIVLSDGIEASIRRSVATSVPVHSVTKDVAKSLATGLFEGGSFVSQASVPNYFTGQRERLKESIGRHLNDWARNEKPLDELFAKVSDSVGRAGRQATAATETAAQTVFNGANHAVMAENLDIIGGVEHVSTLDLRTTPICANYDGKRWDDDFKPIGHDLKYLRKPIHWGCRSLDVDWFREGVPPSERASKDGPVPDSTDYATFFRGLPAEQQRSYLGLGRYELFQEGKITLSDLLNRDGSERTLEDLRGLFAK